MFSHKTTPKDSLPGPFHHSRAGLDTVLAGLPSSYNSRICLPLSAPPPPTFPCPAISDGPAGSAFPRHPRRLSVTRRPTNGRISIIHAHAVTAVWAVFTLPGALYVEWDEYDGAAIYTVEWRAPSTARLLDPPLPESCRGHPQGDRGTRTVTAYYIRVTAVLPDGPRSGSAQTASTTLPLPPTLAVSTFADNPSSAPRCVVGGTVGYTQGGRASLHGCPGRADGSHEARSNRIPGKFRLEVEST